MIMKKQRFIKMYEEPNGRTAGQQIGTGADEIANKFIDYLLKELEELKKENKELKEKCREYEKEYNKEFVEKYGIYPGADEP